VTEADFLAGYGAAQPFQTLAFSAYLGTVSGPSRTAWPAEPWLCGDISPSFLPSLEGCRLGLPAAGASIPGALRGVNAAVGLLLAALTTVWRSAIFDTATSSLPCRLGLLFRRVPPWLVVIVAAGGGAALAAF
jgi:chromate transporter